MMVAMVMVEARVVVDRYVRCIVALAVLQASGFRPVSRANVKDKNFASVLNTSRVDDVPGASGHSSDRLDPKVSSCPLIPVNSYSWACVASTYLL